MRLYVKIWLMAAVTIVIVKVSTLSSHGSYLVWSTYKAAMCVFLDDFDGSGNYGIYQDLSNQFLTTITAMWGYIHSFGEFM